MFFIYLFLISSVFSVFTSELTPLLKQQSYPNYNQKTYNLDNIPVDIIKLIAEKIDIHDIPNLRAIAKNWRWVLINTNKYAEYYEVLRRDNLINRLKNLIIRYRNNINSIQSIREQGDYNLKIMCSLIQILNLISKHDNSILENLPMQKIVCAYGKLRLVIDFNGKNDLDEFYKNININKSDLRYPGNRIKIALCISVILGAILVCSIFYIVMTHPHLSGLIFLGGIGFTMIIMPLCYLLNKKLFSTPYNTDMFALLNEIHSNIV